MYCNLPAIDSCTAVGVVGAFWAAGVFPLVEGGVRGAAVGRGVAVGCSVGERVGMGLGPVGPAQKRRLSVC